MQKLLKIKNYRKLNAFLSKNNQKVAFKNIANDIVMIQYTA